MVSARRMNGRDEQEAPHLGGWTPFVAHEALVQVWLAVKLPLRAKQKVKDWRDFPAPVFFTGEPVRQKTPSGMKE